MFGSKTAMRLKILVGFGVLLLSLISSDKLLAEGIPEGGPDAIVVYNSSLEPVQRIANLPPFSTCSTGAADTLVLGSSVLNSLLVVDRKGVTERSAPLYGPPQRIAAHPDGYLVVTHRGTVADVAPNGTIRRELGGDHVVNALPLPQGQGFVVVRTSGELVRVAWEAKFEARYASDTAGHPVSIKDIALNENNEIVALDSGTNEVIVLDASLKELRRTPVSFNVKEISSLQTGKPFLIALYGDKTLFRIIKPDGTSSSYRSKAPINCAMGLNGNTIGLGTTSSNVVYVPTGANAALDTGRPQLTITSLFAIICYALLGAFGIVFLVKRIDPQLLGRAPNVQNTLSTPNTTGPTPCSSASRISPILSAGALLVAIGGLALSWWSYPELRLTGSLSSWGWYWLGACITATALVFLGRKAGLYQGLTAPKAPTTGTTSGSVSWILIALALSSVALIHYLMLNKGTPPWIISTWIVGQVFILCAFAGPTSKKKWSLGEWIGVLALLAITVITRVYKWTECPPNIHFDFGVTAEEAVMILLKDWYPLFELRAGQTIGRAWLVQMAGCIWLFGLHEWVIRLPSLIWTVGLTLSCYLLGRQTFSHRFGLIFGALVIAQHNLLAYSRLPYVTESTAPFIFCLYFVCRGIQTHALRDWAFAGAWAGWSMMTVRTFTTFPVIGAGIFLFFGLFHFKSIWRHRWHILAMAVSMLVVFSPHYYFYASSQHLSYRLSGVSPLFSDFKLNPDLSLWWAQMGAAFGAILRLPDRPPWPSESSDPICMAITGSLFGAGLLFLLARAKSIATPVSLIAMAGSIGLGSGFLTNPPSYYHHFVGIAFVMFVVAVPLECLFQAAGAIRWRALSGIFAITLLAAVGLSVYEQTRPFLGFCAWAIEGKGDAFSPRSVYSLLSQHLLSRRDHRFVMLAYPQKGPEIHHSNCSIFYGQFSERHEINAPIQSYLPMRPTTQPRAVEFMAFSQLGQLEEVKKVYPRGVQQTFFFDSGRGTMTTYTVSPEDISAAYDSSLSTGASINKDYYSLAPVS